MSKYVHKNECAGGELITCNVTHNSNEDNLNTQHACFFFFFYLPSGSNDWKTLLACSDGDSGPTRDISCGETDSNKITGRKEVKRTVGDKGWTVPIRTCSPLSNHMKIYWSRHPKVAMSDSVGRGLRWTGLLLFSITCTSCILCCTLCGSGCLTVGGDWGYFRCDRCLSVFVLVDAWIFFGINKVIHPSESKVSHRNYTAA